MTAVREAAIDGKLVDFIEKWKDKPGKEIPILHKVQEIYGYVPRDVAMEVARLAEIPLAKIYGIITFYHLFKLNKTGKNNIAVCMGTACYLQGGENLLDEFKRILGIDLNETTEDGQFSIETVRCIGCCGLAPAVTINGKVYGNLKKKDIAGILANYKEAVNV